VHFHILRRLNLFCCGCACCCCAALQAACCEVGGGAGCAVLRCSAQLHLQYTSPTHFLLLRLHVPLLLRCPAGRAQ
jgi:hypothetical protein